VHLLHECNSTKQHVRNSSTSFVYYGPRVHLLTGEQLLLLIHHPQLLDAGGERCALTKRTSKVSTTASQPTDCTQ
jgi:hypothetical protein